MQAIPSEPNWFVLSSGPDVFRGIFGLPSMGFGSFMFQGLVFVGWFFGF